MSYLALSLFKVLNLPKIKMINSPHLNHGSLLGFFDLPPEIRQNIYYYCLAHDDPISIDSLYLSKLAPPRDHQIRMRNLLLLCRQTCLEAAEGIYKYNRFSVSASANMAEIIESVIGNFNVFKVRHLELVITGSYNFNCKIVVSPT